MARVLVTGITGNVGTYVYEELLERHQAVKGAVSSVPKAKDKYRDAELVGFDFLDKNTFERALYDVDRVFLMRPPQIGNPEDLYPFIEAMKEKKVKLVVFLSLMGIENNPVPPHYKIEKYIEKMGLPYCHIRPGFFMQNLSGIHAEEIKESQKILIPAGRSKCSFIDAKDIGQVIAKVLSDYALYQNTTFTVTGREALDYYQVAEILSEVLNTKVTYAKPSWIRFRRHMIKERQLDKKLVNVMVMLYFMTRLGTASAVHSDFEKLMGYKPRTLKQFAEDNKLAWMNTLDSN